MPPFHGQISDSGVENRGLQGLSPLPVGAVDREGGKGEAEDARLGRLEVCEAG